MTIGWTEHKEMMRERLGSEKMNEINLISKLIARRLDKGWSQRDLAKKTGLKQSAIARFEKDDTIPRMDTFNKIARELNFELELKLVPEENKNTKEGGNLTTKELIATNND